MKLNIILFSILLFVSSFFLSNSVNSKSINISDSSQSLEFLQAGYRYEIVFEDGAWWLYIYDENDNLIDKIPIDE